MSRTQGRIIAALIAIGIFIVGSVIKDAETFGLSPQISAILVIVNGVLGLLTNYMPNIWHGEPAPLPGNPTGAKNP